MALVRRIFLFGTSITLLVLLIVLSTSWAINATIGNRTTVKSWIKDSGAYNSIVDQVVKSIEADIKKQKPAQDESVIDTELLYSAINNVLTPDLLRIKAETVLDGVYNWIEGETPDLEFTLDFTEEKNALINSLANEATVRINKLPECSPEQLKNVQDANVFSLSCAPPQATTLISEFRQELENNKDFLPDTSITANDIKVEFKGSETTLNQAIPDVQPWYQFAKQVIWLLLVTVVSWALFVVLLSKNRRYGLRNLAKIFGLASVLILVSSLVVKTIIDNYSVDSLQVNSAGDAVGAAMVEASLPLVRQAAPDIIGYQIWFAILYGIITVVLISYLLLSKHKGNEANVHMHTSPPDSELSATDRKSMDEPRKVPETTKNPPEIKQNEPTKPADTKEPKSKSPKI